jgi:hypothetical protein
VELDAVHKTSDVVSFFGALTTPCLRIPKESLPLFLKMLIR